MEVLKNYIPVAVEFKLPETNMPVSLGDFEKAEEAREFVAKQFVATQEKVEATRFMDEYEQQTMREEYSDVLENQIPELEKKASEKHAILEEAKQDAKQADDMVKMANTKVRDLAREVKEAIKKIYLDNKNTWRIPLDGKYYYYSYFQGELQLVKIKDIPDYEKNDLLNSMSNNESSFAKLEQVEAV